MTGFNEIRLIDNDPYYNMRQIEVMVHHFPQYNWYDAMTGFPYGKVIDWGPVFPLLAAAACILLGATTRPEIMIVASYVPVVLAMVMVPIVFLIGKLLNGWKTGLISALCIAVIAGEYFARSSFGYVSHHIAEVFFSTLFCLILISLLSYTEKHPITTHDKKGLLITGGLSVLAGIFYLLGILTIPTILLFALIDVIFTLIAFIVDFYRGRSTGYLLFINGLIFITVIIGYALFGIHTTGFVLAQYSVAHVYIYALIIAGTTLLYGLSILLKGRKFYLYPASIAGIAIISAVGLFLVTPNVLNAIVQGAVVFFGRPAALNPIVELRPWSIQQAFGKF